VNVYWERFSNFIKKSNKTYVCASYKALGKTRGRERSHFGRKHPEDDHHTDCNPVSVESVDVLEIDRGMAQLIEPHTLHAAPLCWELPALATELPV